MDYFKKHFCFTVAFSLIAFGIGNVIDQKDEVDNLSSKGNGDYCVENSRCLGGQVCIDNYCSCPMATRQYWDGSSCRTLVNGHCNVPLHVRCTNFAYCDTTLGLCLCEEGYVFNTKGFCELEFGKPCGSGSTVPCDTTAGLTCVNGKCACGDQMHKYYPSSRNCTGLVGAICNRGVGCSPYLRCANNVDSRFPPRCLCEIGKTQLEDYTCA